MVPLLLLAPHCWHRIAGAAGVPLRCIASHCWHHAAGSAAVALRRWIPSSSAATTSCPTPRCHSPRGRPGSPGRCHAVLLSGPLRRWQRGHRRPRRGAPAWGGSWPPASAALHTKERSGAAAPLPRRRRQSAERCPAGLHRAAGGGGMHAGCTRDARRVRAVRRAPWQEAPSLARCQHCRAWGNKRPFATHSSGASLQHCTPRCLGSPPVSLRGAAGRALCPESVSVHPSHGCPRSPGEAHFTAF